MNLHTHTNPVNWLSFYNGESWQPVILCSKRAACDWDPISLERACISNLFKSPAPGPAPLNATAPGDPCGLTLWRPHVPSVCFQSRSKRWGFLGREEQCQGKGLVKHKSRYLTQGYFYDLCKLALSLALQKKDLKFWSPVTAAVCQVSGIWRPRQLLAVPTHVPTPSCPQRMLVLTSCAHMASSTQRELQEFTTSFLSWIRNAALLLRRKVPSPPTLPHD